ncbi:MAG TPA: DUF4147 domain-containing protein [Candidatus Norongarragalinales archaeon]|nr:DUF4147 domain-containing protein [Candidatus Norongarragalinales archaeon]
MVQIKGREKLVSYGSEPEKRRAILETYEIVLDSLLPDALLKGKVKYDGKGILVQGKRFELQGKIYVIGAGKAVGKMAEAIEKLLPIEKGVVSIPKGTKSGYGCRKIELVEAGHPYPDAGSVNAAKKMIELSAEVTKDDMVISLISGGGSALMALPEEGITLEEKIGAVKKLMNAGADIFELNSVRKSISAVKGGKLAMHFKRSQLINIVLSDVLGNPLPVIASGPTILDRFTYSEAKDALEKYGLWDGDDAICKAIEKGILVGRLPLNYSKEQPKITSFVIGDNALAVRLAADELSKRGYGVKQYFEISGFAKDAGKKFAKLLGKGESFVAGGETTVAVKSDGIGGRNLEFVLSAASHLIKGTIASLGTDGVDGVSEAAGAIADAGTKEKAKIAGLSIPEYLNLNDSFTFFKNLKDGAIITGPTGTNVCDLMIGLA